MTLILAFILVIYISSCSGFARVSSRLLNNRVICKQSLSQSRETKINMLAGLEYLGLDSITSVSISSTLLSEEAPIGYSSLSLYFTLFLYVLSLPGLYSLVTRSVKVTPVRRTYDMPGPANPTAKPLKQLAAEIVAYFKAMNYESTLSEETITFKGVLGRSTSQAYFLTFCTFLGLGSLGLVLSVLLPDLLGSKAYAITLLSPYAGLYYWRNAQREDTVTVKIETSDDDQTISVFAQGGKEELERFASTLSLVERGKVYVKGLFEAEPEKESERPNSTTD